QDPPSDVSQKVSGDTADDAQAGPDTKDQEAAKAKTKKSKKKKTKAGTSDAGDGMSVTKVKPPKHPSWSPVPALTIDFKARIETELRADTPASGFEGGDAEWQDRRI